MLRVKEIAKKKGIAMKDVASNMGLTYRAMHARIMTNSSLESLEKFAKALDCNVHELIPADKDFAHFYDENGKYLGLRRK